MYATRFQNLAKILTLAVAGVFLGVLAFVALQAMLTPDWISNLAALFFFNRERLIVRASPDSIASGETFFLSWTHEGRRTAGGYVFSYECQSGVSFRTAPDGAAVMCGVPISISDGGVSLTVSAENPVELPVRLTVGFVPAGAMTPELEGSFVVTVVRSALAAAPPAANPPAATPSPRPAPVPASLHPGASKTEVVVRGGTPAVGISVPGGRPDLAIELVSIGYIDAATNQFIATSSVYRSWQSAIVFDVVNRGNAESGSWKLSARLPVFDGFFTPQEGQPSIRPGEKIRYTLGFQHLNAIGENEAVITLDPDNTLNDSNRSNDALRVIIFAFDAR